LQEVEVDENVKQDVRQLAGSIRKLVADLTSKINNSSETDISPE
jgi:hypothetical protein